MGGRVENWLMFDGALRRRGRPPIIVDADFEVGVDEPTRANTGPRVSEAEMETVGSITSVSPGEVIERKIINGQFRPNNSCTLRDCLIVGPSTPPALGDTYNLVDTRSLAITTPVRVEYCTLSPQVRTVDMYGFAYGQFEAYRTLIEGVVDGGSVHGAGTWPSTIHRSVSFRGCMFTDSPWYEYDPRQTDGSHNDFIQAHGSLSLLEIVGCSFGADGEKADTTVLLQQAHGLYDNIVVTDNWFYGNPDRGAVLNMSESRGVGFTDLKFWRNRITAESNHSSPSPIVVKPLSRYPENFGWTGTVGSSPSTWVAGPNASYYMNGPNQGQPVRPKAG